MRLISLLCLPCLFMSLNSFSQINGNYSYSIALKAFSIIQVPKIFNQDSERYLPGKISGGIFKFNDNQVSYRITGNFMERDLSFNNNCMNCDLARGRVKDYAFKIGFEKSFNYARIQPYFAIDMGYRFDRFKGFISAINDQRSIAAVNYLEDTKSGGTIMPGIGMKINPIDQISIFMESGIEFYYAYVRQETTSQDVSASKKLVRFNRGEFLLNPISIGVQIHLGNKN
jgi:hypothetical protein